MMEDNVFIQDDITEPSMEIEVIRFMDTEDELQEVPSTWYICVTIYLVMLVVVCSSYQYQGRKRDYYPSYQDNFSSDNPPLYQAMAKGCRTIV